MNDKTANDTTAITVMGAARAKGGNEGDVRQALHAFVEPARSEDGCLHYELYEDVQYTGSFYTVKMWASQAHLDAHVKNQQSDMNKILPHLSEQLRISVVKPVK